MNWKQHIDLKKVWEKYSDFDEEDFDEDETLFANMKKEMIGELENQLSVPDMVATSNLRNKLMSAVDLTAFNAYWNKLYDYCDSNKIWLATSF